MKSAILNLGLKKKFNTWIFSHSLYPVECEGDSSEEVVRKYPKYLKVFIEHRLEGRLDRVNEFKTKGRGGLRLGAGRPKGTTKEQTKQVRLPLDIATWIKEPGMIDHIRFIMHAYPISREKIMY